MKELLYLSLVFLFFTACQAKLDGKNEESFKTSREKVETNLSQEEKINLEKALRVTMMEAMRLKWHDPDTYKGKSFDKISLDMIDGLSYSSVVDLAEDILSANNEKEIKELTSEVDSLTLQKSEIAKIEKTLDVFKISVVSINMDDFFGEMVPQLQIDYQYLGKENLVGPKAVEYKVLNKSSKEVIQSQTLISGDEASVLESGDVLTNYINLSQTKQSNPKLWNATKYPIDNPNLSDYDITLEVRVLSLVLHGKKVELPQVNRKELDSEIASKKEKIADLKTLKGTLDELELTDK